MEWTALNQRRGLTLGAALALLVGIGFLVFRIGPLAPNRITVMTVKHERITPAVFGIGTVEAQQSWMIGPLTAGRVLRVLVDVGDEVKAGQALAEMEPIDLEQRQQAQLAAQGKAASAQAAARAQVADAQARQALAQSNWLRQQDLARQNFISTAALEVQQQALRSADAALQVVQANVQAAAQEMARVQAESAGVAFQRQSLRMLAPADAVVISRDAEVGSTVVAGQPVLKLVNPQSLWVRMRVDQGRSAGLAAGLAARIVLRSQPQQIWPGVVERVEWQADSVTEERIAQVAFRLATGQLPPTMSMGEMAEVTLDLPATAEGPVVPQASVQKYEGQTGVWRLSTSGDVTFAPVRWGASSLEGWVQALEGLKAEDQVVVYSEKPLQPGARVRVVEALVDQAKS
jgi:HlyD family secretion protein